MLLAGFLILFPIIIVMYTPLANKLASYLKIENEMRPADVIVVLSGGSYPNAALSLWTLERVVHGIRLYKKGMAPKVIFAGGPPPRMHKVLGRYFFGPGSAKTDERVSDAEAMKRLAIELGVPEDAIIVDEHSLHTYENLMNATRIMNERNMMSALLVTSPLHMCRSILVAQRIGVDFIPASTTCYDRYRRHPLERLILFHFTIREFLTLILYKIRRWA